MFVMGVWHAPEDRVDKTTKCCELKVYLKNGHRMTGLFHVSPRTSSAIRPSDALTERTNGLLLLSDVMIYENNVPRSVGAVMVPFDAIAYLELPTGWSARPGPGAGDESAETPAGLNAAIPAPSPTPKPATSKWLVGGGAPSK